jgi:glycosyltransferase involved in cell wall biosynthesis
VTLVTFEKPEHLHRRELISEMRRDLESRGIRWLSLRYHQTPQVPAKMYDALAGWVSSIGAQLRERTAIVHARTFVGGLIGLALARLLRASFIYHNAAGSARHRIAKQLEARLYARADGIIALSERARVTIQALPPVRQRRTPVIVVPSAVDLDRFRCSQEGNCERRDDLRLIYAGSVGARYRLDQAARFAAVAAEELGQVRLHVVTLADRVLVEQMLRASGLRPDAWSIAALPHSQMPDELRQHDAGLSFRAQGLSEHGCSPTKIGEYWACGLPVVSTANVSDTDEIVHRERVGVIVKEHSEAAYREVARGLRTLLKDVSVGVRCRRAAESHYAMGPACERQMTLYRQLLS